jgi:hypothetical protein
MALVTAVTGGFQWSGRESRIPTVSRRPACCPPQRAPTGHTLHSLRICCALVPARRLPRLFPTACPPRQRHRIGSSRLKNTRSPPRSLSDLADPRNNGIRIAPATYKVCAAQPQEIPFVSRFDLPCCKSDRLLERRKYLRPHGDHANEQRNRRQRGSFFDNGAEHEESPLEGTKDEHCFCFVLTSQGGRTARHSETKSPIPAARDPIPGAP